jgi:hypothetical protein
VDAFASVGDGAICVGVEEPWIEELAADGVLDGFLAGFSAAAEVVDERAVTVCDAVGSGGVPPGEDARILASTAMTTTAAATLEGQRHLRKRLTPSAGR